MRRDDEHQDIQRSLKEACDMPPPKPSFVEALRRRLGRELDLTPTAGAAEKQTASRSVRRWRWVAISAAVTAAVVLIVVGAALRRPPEGTGPDVDGHHRTPPLDIPWDPPQNVSPEIFREQYAKYFEPDAVRRQREQLDKDLDVDTLHVVLINTRDGPLGSLFIDKAGKVMLAAPYASVAEFSEGLSLVGTKVDEKTRHLTGWGFIDRTGKIAIPAEYEMATSFREGLAGVQQGGRWGFIDRRGEVVIAPRYVRVEEFRGGVARVWPNHDTAEFIDAKGRVLFQADRWAGTFSEGLIYASLPGAGVPQRGYLDREFKFAIRFDEQGLWPARCEEFHEGRAAVEIGTNTWGFIDREGKLVIPASFKAVGNFSEGLSAVSFQPGILGPWGYIDRSGRMILEPRFLAAGPFQEGLAAVFLPLSGDPSKDSRGEDGAKPPAGDKAAAPIGAPRGKWGFIGKTGRVVIPPRYYAATAFRHGLARVSENPYHVGFIDKTGAYVFQVHEPTYAAGANPPK
jgi:hypothetical protein